MTEPKDNAAEEVVEGAGVVRWGVGRWVAWWGVGTLLQGALVPTLVSAWRADAAGGGGAALACAAGLLLLQMAKAWGAVRRLADRGQPADDVLWAFVPIANLLLAGSLLGKAPSPKERARRIRVWRSQIGALDAWRRGLRALASVAPVAVLGAAAIGLFVAVSNDWLRDTLVPRLMDPSEEGLRQGLQAAAAFFGFYSLVHLTRARERTTASWWPSTLVAPIVLFLLPGLFAGSGSSSTLVYVVMVTAGFEAGLPSLMLGALVAAVLAASDVREAGEALSPSSVRERMRGRTVAVAVVFTLRAQLAAVGGIVVIPAVWFSVSYALADLLAFDGQSGPWSASSALVSGIRGKVLKVLAVWYMAWNLLALLLMLPFVSMGEATSGLFMGGDLPAAAEFGVTFASALTTAACALALRPILRERVALFLEREARRQQKADNPA